MRYQTLALLAVVYTAMVAKADPTQLCTGDLKCDPGYCCSSSGFCGRSVYHCSNTSGCNTAKGSCGIVLLDKQDLPQVITYEELGKSTISDLATKLSQDGSHLMPEDKAKNLTIDSFLQAAMPDKSLTQANKAAPPPNPLPADNTQKTTPAAADPVTKAPSSSSDTTKPASSASRISLDKMSSLALGVLALLM